ncbi:MAG: cryptochrome/photolyase family protein [Planctomycetota bacterium]
MPTANARTLALILGDQLDASYLDTLELDRDQDVILMVEVTHASEAPPSHVQRTVVFLSAMRHHAEALREKGWRIEYVELSDGANTHSFAGELGRAIESLKPERVVGVLPGSFSVRSEIEEACDESGVEMSWHEDPHFLCSTDEFGKWASGRKELIMEYFYREQRKRLGVLMTDDGKPEGGEWNYDKSNRKAFKSAPDLPHARTFRPDDITKRVIEDVAGALPDLPGRIDMFEWPVTRREALAALRDFVEQRLPCFGDFQDAMWTGEDKLYHSMLSSSLNLKLLNPREVVDAAVAAYDAGEAPLNAVEGFVRQIIGWREFIRGVYFYEGEGYDDRNALEQHGALPDFYWTGETDMRCMGESLRSVLDRAYGHHIARLMVTGNFALISGISPQAINDWYLGMYVDAINWVTSPNTVGMAMHADGGVVGTKPYAASGKYIDRMGNYCKGCRYDVKQRTGEDACPFNTFYWDFLIRNQDRFKNNRRMTMILKNVERMDGDQRVEITVSADKLRDRLGVGSIKG